MPFKSKAQRRKFAELLIKGKITDEAYERWNKETGGAELPEYVDPKKKKRKAGAKPTSKRKANRKAGVKRASGARSKPRASKPKRVGSRKRA